MLAMGNFNRGSRPSGGRGFARRGFNGRDVRSPAQMHPAVCDNCNKNCEVPFRPTSGKPIFCSDCFENKKGPGAGRFEGRDESRFQRSDERQMFDAVCDDCGNDCKVPFRPSGEKPIFCSNCFGDKKGNVYIGSLKYPYYGQAIKLWTDSKIILSTNSNNKIY